MNTLPRFLAMEEISNFGLIIGGTPLVQIYNISIIYHASPTSSVSEFLVNKCWTLPQNIMLAFFDLLNAISNILIHLEDIDDKRT